MVGFFEKVLFNFQSVLLFASNYFLYFQTWQFKSVHECMLSKLISF